MKHTTFIAGIVAVAASLTAFSAAADGGPGGGPMRGVSFETLDVNNDAQITQIEMDEYAVIRFDAADLDKNGSLNAEELQARASESLAKRVEHMISRMDKDGDGALSPEEMQHGKKGSKFEKADADNSGGLSKEEFADMRSHGKHNKKKK